MTDEGIMLFKEKQRKREREREMINDTRMGRN